MYTRGCAQSNALRHRACCFVTGDGKVPADWKQSFIVCLYKEKGDALDRGNYRGLKLIDGAVYESHFEDCLQPHKTGGDY